MVHVYGVFNPMYAVPGCYGKMWGLSGVNLMYAMPGYGKVWGLPGVNLMYAMPGYGKVWGLPGVNLMHHAFYYLVCEQVDQIAEGAMWRGRLLVMVTLFNANG